MGSKSTFDIKTITTNVISNAIYAALVAIAALVSLKDVFDELSTPITQPLSTLLVAALVLAVPAFYMGRLFVKQKGEENEEAVDGFKEIRGDEGRELLESIANAKNSIVTTAFSADKPSSEYLDILLGKLDSGVAITRVISAEIEQRQQSSWLNQFADKPHYKEKKVSEGLPFDIYIFDEKQTYIYFPADKEHDQFKDGIVFQSNEIAKRFRRILDKSIDKAKKEH